MNLEENAYRLKMMSDSLVKEGIDALLFYGREVHNPANLLYQLLGGLSWSHAIIVGRHGKPVVVASEHDAGNVPRELFDVVEYRFDADPPKIVIGYMDTHEMLDVGLATSKDTEPLDATSYGMFEQLKRASIGTRVALNPDAGENALYSAYARRTPSEIEGLRRAVKTTDELFDEAERYVMRLGTSEREIYEWFAKQMERRNVETSWARSRCPIVAVGANSVRAHQSYGDDIVKKGCTLFIDFGVMDPVTKMPADLQRCYFFPDPYNDAETERVLKMFQLQRRAKLAGIDQMVPDSNGYKVDKAGREIVTDAGYPEFSHAFGHTLSVGSVHGIGPLAGPLVPRYGDRPLRKLETDMVLTAEPSVIDPEGRQGRISVEDDVLITPNGPEVLNKSQQSLTLFF